MQSGPAGFRNAPVTKALIVTSAALTLLLSSSHAAPPAVAALSHEALYIRGEWWRLPLSCLTFASTPALFVGCLLLYGFRVLERQLGASKYTVLFLFSSIVSVTLQSLLLLLLSSTSRTTTADDDDAETAPWSFTPGPLGFLFALFVLYHADVPPTARVTIASRLHLSDKALPFVGGAQLLCSAGWASLLPGLTGVVAGALYRSNVLGVRKAKVPDPIARFASTWLLPIVAWPSNPSATPSHAQQRRRQQQGHAPAQHLHPHAFQGQPPPPPVAAPEPSESDVESLVAMGFERSAAVAALRRARNDLHLATNLLLEG
eukprot:TRINITY_DN8174_c1_g4_i1.p1 TRINITY_DN8174_c1_g4~~TRINITY_DN8174_c1_g4_i1.p1  ORF type:complete len:317 (-),score=-5.31 TRINITY_DN8174_c1_g4_i1:180-1130(-)